MAYCRREPSKEGTIINDGKVSVKREPAEKEENEVIIQRSETAEEILIVSIAVMISYEQLWLVTSSKKIESLICEN